MQKNRRKKNKLISVLWVILGILLVICISLFLKKNDDKELKNVDEVKEQNSEENRNDVQEAVASYEIETDYCKLYFPESWKEQIKVKYTEEAGYKAEFYGLIDGKEEKHLFDVCFNSDDGVLLGYLKDNEEIINISIDMNELEFDDTWTQEEVDQIYAMQEDMNFLMESLSEIENYIEL